jgi:hypothetical protein
MSDEEKSFVTLTPVAHASFPNKMKNEKKIGK